MYSKVTKVYEDTMLNIAVIYSVEIHQMEQGKILWVLGDSTVTDQLAALPYFKILNYVGVGQALPKYISKI